MLFRTTTLRRVQELDWGYARFVDTWIRESAEGRSPFAGSLGCPSDILSFPFRPGRGSEEWAKEFFNTLLDKGVGLAAVYVDGGSGQQVRPV